MYEKCCTIGGIGDFPFEKNLILLIMIRLIDSTDEHSIRIIVYPFMGGIFEPTDAILIFSSSVAHSPTIMAHAVVIAQIAEVSPEVP